MPEGGESINNLRRRIKEGLDFVRQYNNPIIITHSGVISNLLMMLYGFTYKKGFIQEGEKIELILGNGDVVYHKDGKDYSKKMEELLPKDNLL